MSEQALDLRRSVQIVRRHKVLIGTVTALGLLVGAAYSVHEPAMLTSTAVVVLPQSVQSAGVTGVIPSPGQDSYMATQIVIATSDPVLSGALPHISPAVSLQRLHSEIEVTSPTSGILSIGASARTAAQAEAAANAVASSYIAYVGSASSPVGFVLAHTLNAATSATGTAPIIHQLTYALLGAVLAALIGVVVALAISRNDRRLLARDEIANSVGIPVLASFPVSHPADAAGWTKLLEDYEPGALPALHMRQALQQLEMAGAGVNGRKGTGSSLAVLSLSTDPGAIALGPQLAVFAASQGIPTTLVIGPQQDLTVTAALRTACTVPPPASSKRPIHLRVTVSDGRHVNRPSDAALTVVVAVIDGRTPRVADTIRTTATALGVSAGVATAEQLARVVTSAAADGREIAGILVADPEPTDRTSGRIPRAVRIGTVQTAHTPDGHSYGDQKAYDLDEDANIYRQNRW